MKKILVAALCSALVVSAASAYNPPVGGENLFELASPRLLTGASSAAGGGLFSAGSDSLVANPSLPAKEQRTVLSASYSGLISANEENDIRYGNVFETGILIPMKWGVLSGLVNGTFVPFKELNLGNSINLKAGISKQITDSLDIGIGLNGGLLWGTGADWSVSANIGGSYTFGKLGFIDDFRIGSSLLNLGKNYTKTDIKGLRSDEDSTQFPQIATLKIGAAGSFISTEAVKLGASLDFTTPCFMNLITDLGVQCAIKDIVFINIAEKINLAELMNSKINLIPSIGVFVKFNFNVKNNEYMEKNGWSQSEMSVGAAYKNMYKTVNAVSAGVDVYLGMKDETPPAIILWDDEDE